MITAVIDMDGVLVDFVRGALEFYKSPLKHKDCRWNFPGQEGFLPDGTCFSGGGDPKFWAPLGYDFWSKLKWTEEGQSLIKQLETEVGAKNIAILSNPCQTEGCVEGKLQWIKDNLPEYRKRVFLGTDKHLFSGPKKVLIDDHDPNVDAWQVHGPAVLVPRPWNSAIHLTDDAGGFHLPGLMGVIRRTFQRIV